MKTSCLKFLLAALAALLALTAQAQNYPDRAITFVVGWAPGGSTDVMSRLIGAKLTERLGQTILIVNRPGATGTIGARFAAGEKPDGYTFYYGTNSTYALAPWLYKSLPYDFNEAFEPVSFVGAMPMIVGVHPNVPAKTMRELVDLAKKSARKLTFGSSSPGATSHVAAELLMQNAGFEMIHVPYKGGGPALTAILAGEIDLLFNDVTTFEPHINTGKVRALAATSGARLPNMPNLPTVAESGLPGFEVSTTNAVFVPKGTPAAAVERFRAALVAVLSEPTMGQELLRRGMLVQHSTPAELGATVRREQQMWKTLLQSRGITLGQ